MKSTVIAVFCYKRADKLTKCISALLKNPECKDMEIIFFADGFKNQFDEGGVLEVRRFIEGLSGFKFVYKKFRAKNYGVEGNFKKGLEFLCQNYDQFIVVEDDLLVSSNYLKFLFDALDFYRDFQDVFCITAFNFAIDAGSYSYDSIVYRRFTSWGWAGWSDRIRNVNFNKEYLASLVNNHSSFKPKLVTEGYDLWRLLKKQVRGAVSTWDIQMQVYVAQEQLKVIYPTISKVNNIGFDSESTHTSGINYVASNYDDGNKREFLFCPSEFIVSDLQMQIRKPYSLPFLIKRKFINVLQGIYHKIKA